MNKINIYQVDAFTSKTFSGNAAAVCPLKDWLPDEIMQSIAMENNLSETAFFINKDNKLYIRWFTPLSEIDLAGHPTLATAHIIFEKLLPGLNNIEFYTKKGHLLKVYKKNNIIYMNFPSYNSLEKFSKLEDFSHALRAKPVKILSGLYGMAVFENQTEIINIKPNFELISKLDFNGIIVTAPGDSCDFVSRFFAPILGIQEDPVTGSAHCQLIPFWSEVLNKKNLLATQLSKRRGELYCTHLGDRVIIGGKAITYMSGTIVI